MDVTPLVRVLCDSTMKQNISLLEWLLSRRLLAALASGLSHQLPQSVTEGMILSVLITSSLNQPILPLILSLCQSQSHHLLPSVSYHSKSYSANTAPAHLCWAAILYVLTLSLLFLSQMNPSLCLLSVYSPYLMSAKQNLALCFVNPVKIDLCLTDKFNYCFH